MPFKTKSEGRRAFGLRLAHSGRWKQIREAYQQTPEFIKASRRGGYTRIARHGNPATPESNANGGRVQGAKNAANGHMRRIVHERWHPGTPLEICTRCNRNQRVMPQCGEE